MRAVVRFAVAAVVAAGAALAAPAAPAAAQPAHVAVVVAGVGQACVPAGGDGLQTLSSAFTVTYGQRQYAGFVLEINGVGTTTPDDTHYWSYWHDTGSGWQYSSTGGSGYYPPAGSIEGWSFDDGQASAPPPPASSYASICAGRDPGPAPIGTRRSTSAAPRRSTSTSQSAYVPPAPASTTAAARESRTPVRTATRTTKAVSHAATPTVSASQTATRAAPRLSPAAVRGPAARTAASSSGLPPWGTALGIVAIALLGGLAWWRARAQHRA